MAATLTNRPHAMNFICTGMPVHEALQQATTTPHDPEALRAAGRASAALQELMAAVGPQLLAWSITQPGGASVQAQRAGLEALAAGVEEARDVARAIAQ